MNKYKTYAICLGGFSLYSLIAIRIGLDNLLLFTLMIIIVGSIAYVMVSN